MVELIVLALIITSLILGILGSLASCAYLINRLFFRPKLIINTTAQPTENYNGIVFQGSFYSKKEVTISSVIIYYDITLWDFQPSSSATHLQVLRTSKPNALNALQIPIWNGPRALIPANILLNFKFNPMLTRDKMHQTSFILSIEAQQPEKTLPWFFDMFPPKICVLESEVKVNIVDFLDSKDSADS